MNSPFNTQKNNLKKIQTTQEAHLVLAMDKYDHSLNFVLPCTSEFFQIPYSIKQSIKSLFTKEKVVLAAAIIFAAAISYYEKMSLIILFSGYYVFRYFNKASYKVKKKPNLDPSSIYFFQGNQNYKGICFESLEALKKSTKSLFAGHPVANCQADQMKISKWKKNDLLVFPGGKCTDWDDLLTERKKIKIYNWYKQGGRILGICAGGYYCVESSEFIVNAALKLHRIRQIALFPGKCYGPAYSAELKVVKVKWIKNQKEGYVTLLVEDSLFLMLIIILLIILF